MVDFIDRLKQSSSVNVNDAPVSTLILTESYFLGLDSYYTIIPLKISRQGSMTQRLQQVTRTIRAMVRNSTYKLCITYCPLTDLCASKRSCAVAWPIFNKCSFRSSCSFKVILNL